MLAGRLPKPFCSSQQPPGLLLPYLFCTPTIKGAQRSYYTESGNGKRKVRLRQDDGSHYGRGRIDNRFGERESIGSTVRTERRERDMKGVEEPNSDGNETGAMALERAAAAQDSKSAVRRQPHRQTWTEHVPFEKVQQESASIEDGLTGSTITPSEKKVFERLFQMRKERDMAVSQSKEQKQNTYGKGKESGKTPQQEKHKIPRTEISLDEILDDAVGKIAQGTRVLPRFPQALRPLAEKVRDEEKKMQGIQTLKKDERKKLKGNLMRAKMRTLESTASAVAQAAQEELKRVDGPMRDAKTDVQLWEVLEKEVLSRLRALKLDGTDGPNSTKSPVAIPPAPPAVVPSSDKSLIPPITTNPIKPYQRAPITELDLLTATLPKHLVRFLRSFQTSFPSSPLTLSFLPLLKRLGPASFALGASTTLYNQYLALYSPLPNPHNLNLERMNAVLEEMEREVYEFDAGSSEVVSNTLRLVARMQRHGYGGEAVGQWLRADAGKSGIGRLLKWEKVIGERLMEKALKEVREREAAQEESKESSEIVGGEEAVEAVAAAA